MATETKVTRYESLADFIEKTAQMRPACGGRGMGEYWRYGSYSTLLGTQVAAQAGDVKQSTLDSYMKVREELEPIFEELRSEMRVVSRKRVRRVCDDGDDIDMDRYMNRDMDCWVVARRGGKMQQITLGVNFAHLGCSDEKDFVEVAALAAAASDLLSMAGFPVEIRFFANSAPGSEGFASCITFPVKKAEDALDTKAILTSSIPGMFRELAFRVRETVQGASNGGGFNSSNLTPALMAEFGVDFLVTRDSASDYKLMLTNLIRKATGGSDGNAN
jgi:hypothetical protein